MPLAMLRLHAQAHYCLAILDQQAKAYLAGRTKRKKSKSTPSTRPAPSFGTRAVVRPVLSRNKSAASKPNAA